MSKVTEAGSNCVLKDVTLSICMVCHKIHSSSEYWERLEDYFAKHAGLSFSHGICPSCVKVTYGKLGEQVLARQQISLPYVAEQKSNARKTSDQDEILLQEMRAFAAHAVGSDNPLSAEIEKIVGRYAKLQRRFEKIVSLSDSYQSQLRDFNLRLELMARIDALTGINNRGSFMEMLALEVDRAKRYERTFSVLMLDLDHFKSVNDTYGHSAGDEALRTMAGVLHAAGLRKCDFFGRIGGEEFAVALPETDVYGAAEVAERIRAKLEKTPVKLDDREFFITASIGAGYYKTCDDCETLLRRADQAMYRAKDSGRNTVCLEP